MTMHSYTMRWWKSPFASVTITMDGTNPDHLKQFVWDEAYLKGYKPRKWYEIWRWFDTGFPSKGTETKNEKQNEKH